MSTVMIPIDTSRIVLSEDLCNLAEKLAENAHDIWACQRINQGWKYGSRRDDDCKHHPFLVPYCQLAESEKEYERNAAINTLKVIMALGYHLEHS